MTVSWANAWKRMNAVLAAAQPGAVLGLKRCALHLVARGKALAPRDTGNLQNSIHSENEPIPTAGGGLKIRVGASAVHEGENYGYKTHENMAYDGPNVGGSHEQGRGEKTMAKGVSAVEASDGSAGGKYLERPIRNPATLSRWEQIVGKAVKEALAKAVR